MKRLCIYSVVVKILIAFLVQPNQLNSGIIFLKSSASIKKLLIFVNITGILLKATGNKDYLSYYLSVSGFTFGEF